ncbi:MAG: tripartite tricarboxylate transporter substrate binding protein [Betaproteobacteria bacterium]|nr:MAG: tripartite tricarboxylate transporter substrate binding protein [Betaproteobacteria bacterium]
MNIKFAPAMLAAFAALATGETLSQTYPVRPIRFLVGSPPGSGNDLVSRLLAQKLAERFGQPVIVEQKPGGAGLLANDALAKSPPDGHTLVLLSGAHPATAALNRALPYDPVRDFGMVGTVVAYPLVISVAPNSEIRSFPDLIARARDAPGKLTYSMTPGTLVHLLGEWINIEAGIAILGVPYKGSANALVDVLAGRVDATIETGTASFGHIRSGKLRALALSSPARHPALPELQTISETLPGVEMSSWLGLAVPAATTRAIIERLNGEIRSILKEPEVRQRLADLSGVPAPSSPEEMRALVEREIARWKRVVELKNIERQN